MGEVMMERSAIIARMVKDGWKKHDAVMYADSFVEYREASSNIREYGTIVLHPRTKTPIENPYLKIRDGAMRKLKEFAMAPAWLWEELV